MSLPNPQTTGQTPAKTATRTDIAQPPADNRADNVDPLFRLGNVGQTIDENLSKFANFDSDKFFERLEDSLPEGMGGLKGFIETLKELFNGKASPNTPNPTLEAEQSQPAPAARTASPVQNAPAPASEPAPRLSLVSDTPEHLENDEAPEAEVIADAPVEETAEAESNDASAMLYQDIGDEDLDAQQAEIEQAGGEFEATMANVFNEGPTPKGVDANKILLLNKNTEWNRNTGPVLIVNGIEYDAAGNPIDGDGSEAVDQWREATEQVRAWEEQRSKEFPGMSNKEVLENARFMADHAEEFADEAVKEGKIREDQKADYEQYIKWREQDLEYQRTHGGQHDPSLTANLANADPAFKTTYDKQIPEATKTQLDTGFSTDPTKQIQNRIIKEESNQSAIVNLTAVDNKAKTTKEDEIFPSAPDLKQEFTLASSPTPSTNSSPEFAANVTQPKLVISAPQNSAMI